MWSYRLGAGSGRKDNSTHFFEITKHILNVGEYYMIKFDVTSRGKDRLSCKLKDGDGCQHDLPYLFKKGQLDQFYIIVDGATTDYSFKYTMDIWPKTLPAPIAKYCSISTVHITSQYSGQLTTPPSIRYRKKGEEDWISTNIPRITFDRCDEIYEAQLFYQLRSDIIVESPILNVECMWRHFDIEKESQIDLDKWICNQRIDITVNSDSLYQTRYIATVRMIQPLDHEDYNKETKIFSFADGEAGPTRTPVKMVPGASYEFKLSILRPQVSYCRVIDVPCYAPVEENLWTTLFGDTDHVAFQRRDSQWIEGPINWVSKDIEMTETNIKTKILALYKHGTYLFHSTFKNYVNSLGKELSYFTGSFKLYRIDDTKARIELTKSFQQILPFKPPSPILSETDPTYQAQVPSALILPELIQHIADFVDYNQKLTNRRVCKYWYSVFQPTIVGTLTSKSMQLLDQTWTKK